MHAFRKHTLHDYPREATSRDYLPDGDFTTSIRARRTSRLLLCTDVIRDFRVVEPRTVASKLEAPIQFARKIIRILRFVTVFPTSDILARLIPGLTPKAS